MSGELAFIERLRRLATHPGARNFDDDCAVIGLGSETLLLTHDMLVEGIHYLPEQDMADVAWRLVATNMSDLAAKGGEPIGVLLGYALGKGDERFVEGLEEALAHYDAPLLGGDTVSGEGPRTLGLTAIGRATCRPVPSRGGAQPGDRLYLTGPLGAAMTGLEALRAGHGDSSAYRRPRALLAEGQALAPIVSAMMDVSDGLLLDALRLARASSVTLAIDSALVPLAVAEARRPEALRWGDDYQLLFTLPATLTAPVPAWCIGEVRPLTELPVLLDGQPLDAAGDLGFQH